MIVNRVVQAAHSYVFFLWHEFSLSAPDGWQAKPNELLRFTLTGAEEELVDQSEGGMELVDQSEGCMGEGEPAAVGLRGVVHGLRFDKRCSKLRPMADTWSKVKKTLVIV